MANNYFKFKHFTIYQDDCAMKVTTDGCLFGSITAAELLPPEAINILDIGTGTGLLSLMVAQKNPAAIIDAVEIERATANQAFSNCDDSIFKSQITVYHTDIKLFDPECKYDFICTNPPFYENDLRSKDDHRNKALHDASLTLEDLLKQIERLIKPTGSFSILLPAKRADYYLSLATNNGWCCNGMINVKQTEKHDSFRSIFVFSKNPMITNIETIIIKEHNAYTERFKSLLKDYYLYL